MSVFAFLQNKMTTRLSQEGNSWLQERLKLLSYDFNEKDFYLTFSMTPRYTGKEPLQFSGEALQQAHSIMEGWHPQGWTADLAVRAMFLISIGQHEKSRFLHCLNQVYEHADVNETIAIYKSLPLLPYPVELQNIAREGIRSNMQSAFDAIALHNPYPYLHLSEEAWNQMVLKAVFIQRPVYKIFGIDDRKNKELAHMLIDLAHERWAAGRYVMPEHWRPVVSFVNENNFEDIAALLQSEDPLTREAGALVCYDSNYSEAKHLLEQHAALKNGIEKNEITWDLVGKKYHEPETVKT